MAEIFEFPREPKFASDPTDVSVVRFFEGTPFAEPVHTRPAPSTVKRARIRDSEPFEPQLIAGRRFGAQQGYAEAPETAAYDRRRAELDSHYIEGNPERMHEVNQTLAQAAEELSVIVASLRERPCERPLTMDIHDLVREFLQGGMLTWHTDEPRYGRLVVELQDRIAAAQRFIVETRQAPRI